jgi:osmoprotectant transport system permease protein
LLDKFIAYGQNHYDKLLGYLLDHLQLCAITLIISLLIAIPASLILSRHKRVSKAVIAVLGAIYSIPSMALFALLVPVFGLGETTAIFVLVIYNQFILVRNIIAGFEGIDSNIIEAARGMGMSPMQSFFKIKLPLAMPVILSGIRISVVTTIAIATIAATIHAGGLGVLLFDGLQTMNMVKMLWGTILAAAIALIFNSILFKIEARQVLKARGELSPRKIKKC